MTKGVQVAGVPHAVVSAGAPALDGITASVANIDAWLRVNVNSKIERCLPRWATANRVTVANAVFAVVCIGAALYVDGAPYWEAMALQSLVITMILVYGVVDLLVRYACSCRAVRPCLLFAACTPQRTWQP